MSWQWCAVMTEMRKLIDHYFKSYLFIIIKYRNSVLCVIS